MWIILTDYFLPHDKQSASGEERETNKMQPIWCLLSNFYLNMFRASLCPSSGEQECALPHMVFCTGSEGCGCVELGRKLCALWRFLSLHPTFMMQGHKSLKLCVIVQYQHNGDDAPQSPRKVPVPENTGTINSKETSANNYEPNGASNPRTAETFFWPVLSSMGMINCGSWRLHCVGEWHLKDSCALLGDREAGNS